jgi:hypothetical protein
LQDAAVHNPSSIITRIVLVTGCRQLLFQAELNCKAGRLKGKVQFRTAPTDKTRMAMAARGLEPLKGEGGLSGNRRADTTASALSVWTEGENVPPENAAVMEGEEEGEEGDHFHKAGPQVSV